MRALLFSPRGLRRLPISRRLFRTAPAFRNKQIEPLLPERNEDDQFSEMMDDRTNALLRSLGIDVAQFVAMNFPGLAKPPNKTVEPEAAQNEKPSPDPSISKSETDTSLDKSALDDTAFVKTAAKVQKQAESPLSTALVAQMGPALKRAQTASLNYFIDTQDIYAELRAAGLADGQAEIMMRTIQEVIHELVVTCKARAVPVAAAANEAYLFDAASSEVRNEISNSRQAQATTYRSGLARLQRDVEILEHSATEMTNLLISDMDIEVHDRKNAARAEENLIQLRTQELNNKISTRLNSDLKSEIENLRWQITRRSLTAIGLVAALFIWITQSTSSKKTAKTQERQRNTSGKPLPVHVLAPSMSMLEDVSFEATHQVEDLNSMTQEEHTEEN